MTQTSTYTVSPTATQTPTVSPTPVYILDIYVYNEAGEVVKHISSSGAYEMVDNFTITSGSTFSPDDGSEVVIDVGGYIYKWNGKNDQGASVGNGVYYIKVVVKDDYGYEHISVDSVTVLTNNVKTEARIYNTAGELVKIIPVTSPVIKGSKTLTLDPAPPAAFYPDEAGMNKLTIHYSDITLEWNGTNNNGLIVDNGVLHTDSQCGC